MCAENPLENKKEEYYYDAVEFEENFIEDAAGVRTYINSIDVPEEEEILNFENNVEDRIIGEEEHDEINMSQISDYLVYHLGEKRAKAHMHRLMADSGANNSFYNDKTRIHNLKYYKTPAKAYVADQRSVQVLGYGYLKIRADDRRIIHVPVKYAPQLPNIISTRHLKKRSTTWDKAMLVENDDDTGEIILQGKMCQGDNLGSTVKFATTYFNDLPYINSEPIAVDNSVYKISNQPDITCSLEDGLDEENSEDENDAVNQILKTYKAEEQFEEYVNTLGKLGKKEKQTPFVNKIASKAENMLWHHRLVHHNYGDIARLHGSVDGIPKLTSSPEHGILPCPACITGKICDAHMGKEDIHSKPDKPLQALHMDFGFVQNRKKRPDGDEEYNRVVSSGGYNSYLLIKDLKTKYRWLLLTKNKQPPIELLRTFMRKYNCKTSANKWIRTDRGGELNGSEEFRKMMWEEFGYQTQATGAHASSQNGAVERGNRDIAEKFRTML